MNYDFDKEINRRGTNSLKWNVPEEELPMWVADMDFETAPEIQAAIRERASQGVFGYSVVPKEWNQAYGDWWERRHGFRMDPDWLIFCSGVIPAVSGVIGRLTKEDERILIQPPVYNGFYHVIERSGRKLLENPLVYDGEAYQMDFEDLERKLADPKVSLMLLCNPQNPSGRIWTRGELEQVGSLCAKYHVILVSDEIHCDITDPGCAYTPFASVSDICRKNSISCIAPTKTFNLAGLQTAAAAVPDRELREQVRKGIEANEASEPNAFSVDGAIAAFTKGEPWLEALRVYIRENKRCVEDFLARELPQVHLVYGEASYLVWLEYKKMGEDGRNFAGFLREHAGLYLTDGKEYGENGRSFLRMNIGCPKSRVTDGLVRLKKGVELFEETD